MPKITSARQVQNIRHGWHLFRNRKTLWQMLREVLNGRYSLRACFVNHRTEAGVVDDLVDAAVTLGSALAASTA